MMIFQEVQKNFAFLGINPLKQRQQNVLNIRNVITIIILAHGFIITNVHLLCKSNAFNEYVGSFWVTCSFTTACVNFVVLILQTPKVFDFIGNFELIIQKSEYLFLYLKNPWIIEQKL